MDNNQKQPKSMETIRSEFEKALPESASRELQRDIMDQDEYTDPLVQFAFDLFCSLEEAESACDQQYTTRLDDVAARIMAAMCSDYMAIRAEDAAVLAYAGARALAAERDK